MAGSTTQYLRCNPESYVILGILDADPQGHTFADITSMSGVDASRCKSLLMRLKNYSLVECVQLKRTANWRLTSKSCEAVHSMLIQRGTQTTPKTPVEVA